MRRTWDGRLDCASALTYVENGSYAKSRVFFRDEATAVSAGYRPCLFCLRDEYTAWKGAA